MTYFGKLFKFLDLLPESEPKEFNSKEKSINLFFILIKIFLCSSSNNCKVVSCENTTKSDLKYFMEIKFNH